MFKKDVPVQRMKLSEFISQTIKEVIDGVSDAQQYAKGKDAELNPTHVNWSDTKRAYFKNMKASGEDEAQGLTPIDFDIVITIGDSNKVEGGIGVFAASLGLGVKGKAEDHSETANRIKFQILTKLPQQNENVKHSE